jgi:hypothetical protein
MASIILPSRWTRQPVDRAELDPTPLGFVRPRDVFAFNDGRLSDVDGRYPLSVTGTPTIGVAGSDKAAVFASASSKLATTGNLAVLGVGTAKSALLRVRPRALSTSYEYALGVNGLNIFVRHSSASNNWGFFDGTLRASGELLTKDVFTNLLVKFDGTDAHLYRDGRFVITIAGAGGAYWGTAPFYFNDGSSGTGLGSACDISLAAIWDRLLPDSFAKEITRNPWQIFKPKKQVIYSFSSGITALRFARPSSDLSAGAWTPSTGSDLYAMLDETTASDTDYIETTTASTCEVALNAVTDPATSSGQVITIRAQSANGNNLVATLKQGATTIATRTFTSLGASWADYTITLSGAECDAITDYADLSVTLEAQ